MSNIKASEREPASESDRESDTESDTEYHVYDRALNLHLQGRSDEEDPHTNLEEARPVQVTRSGRINRKPGYLQDYYT